MFTLMLKHQRVTFVSDVEQAEQYSPFRLGWNERNNTFYVSKIDDNGLKSPVAAGMCEDEAHACVMFKANEYIFRNLQKGN